MLSVAHIPGADRGRACLRGFGEHLSEALDEKPWKKHGEERHPRLEKSTKALNKKDWLGPILTGAFHAGNGCCWDYHENNYEMDHSLPTKRQS